MIIEQRLSRHIQHNAIHKVLLKHGLAESIAISALRKFAIRNSNYKSLTELASAIRRYIIWRNKNQ
ncbi:Uncharacterised protein [uncultured archaeon]|nr:Uncharacterised protein [uncultured archaeon]